MTAAEAAAVKALQDWRIDILEVDEIIAIHHEAPNMDEWLIVEQLRDATRWSVSYDLNTDMRLCQDVERAAWNGQ